MTSPVPSIELRARSIVEGSMHGLHRSPYLGMSVEFSSHREYTPGDDLRHLNWKLYARHDRLYIKEYDADHAFANPSGGKYNGDAAKDAWKKTTAFLAANLK